MLLVEVVTVICDVSSINSKFESGTRKKSIGNGNKKQFILFRNRNIVQNSCETCFVPDCNFQVPFSVLPNSVFANMKQIPEFEGKSSNITCLPNAPDET